MYSRADSRSNRLFHPNGGVVQAVVAVGDEVSGLWATVSPSAAI